MFLLHDDRLYDEYEIERPLPILNDTIHRRYRKKEYKFLSRNVMKKLDTFANNIKLKQDSGDIITTMDWLNNRMYCYIANLGWDKKGKKNNLSKKDLIAE